MERICGLGTAPRLAAMPVEECEDMTLPLRPHVVTFRHSSSSAAAAALLGDADAMRALAQLPPLPGDGSSSAPRPQPHSALCSPMSAGWPHAGAERGVGAAAASVPGASMLPAGELVGVTAPLQLSPGALWGSTSSPAGATASGELGGMGTPLKRAASNAALVQHLVQHSTYRLSSLSRSSSAAPTTMPSAQGVTGGFVSLLAGDTDSVLPQPKHPRPQRTDPEGSIGSAIADAGSARVQQPEAREPASGEAGFSGFVPGHEPPPSPSVTWAVPGSSNSAFGVAAANSQYPAQPPMGAAAFGISSSWGPSARQTAEPGGLQQSVNLPQLVDSIGDDDALRDILEAAMREAAQVGSAQLGGHTPQPSKRNGFCWLFVRYMLCAVAACTL
jgi:hypothetical protein